MANYKVLVIGLDGADPFLIQEFVSKGYLPNISKVLREGTSGILLSTIPSSSPVAWTSFLTGVNPRKHGIFSFVKFDRKEKKFHMVTSKDIQSPTLWEILSKLGKKVAFVNVPMSYPPQKVNGIMISGITAPMEVICRNFTYPLELSKLLQKKGYKVEPTPVFVKSIKAYVKELINSLVMRKNAALELYKQNEWDFFIVVFTEPDRLQHFIFDYEHPYLLEMYKLLDKSIGDFLSAIDDTTTVILLSDHGFAQAEMRVSLNDWLLREKYLRIKRKKTLFGLYSKTMIKLVVYSGLLDKVVKFLPDNFLKKIKYQLNTLNEIDWTNTKVFTIEGKYIYILDKNNMDKLREEIREKLLNLQDPDGKLVVSEVYRTKDLYRGMFKEEPGQLLVRLCKGYRHSPSFDQNGKIFRRENVYKGVHHDSEKAFFAIWGENIRRGFKTQIKIFDLAPTILYILGVDPPKYMDGKVIFEIFADKKSKIETKSEKIKIYYVVKKLKGRRKL